MEKPALGTGSLISLRMSGVAYLIAMASGLSIFITSLLLYCLIYSFFNKTGRGMRSRTAPQSRSRMT